MRLDLVASYLSPLMLLVAIGALAAFADRTRRGCRMNRGVALLVHLLPVAFPGGEAARLRLAAAFVFAMACGILAEHGTGGDPRCGSFALAMGVVAWVLLTGLAAITAPPDGADVPAETDPPAIRTPEHRHPDRHPYRDATPPTPEAPVELSDGLLVPLPERPLWVPPWRLMLALGIPCGVIAGVYVAGAGVPPLDVWGIGVTVAWGIAFVVAFAHLVTTRLR